jgi:hypothetical protein
MVGILQSANRSEFPPNRRDHWGTFGFRLVSPVSAR